MRYPISGEIAKLALVAIASVSTVGVFAYLATHERDRLLPSSLPATSVSRPAPSPPALELRRERAEPLEPTPRPVTVEETGAPSLPEPQSDSGRNVDVSGSEPPTTPAIEKAVVKDASVLQARTKRRAGRADAESDTPGKRAAFGRTTRKRDIFGPLPNKKCGEPEDPDRESPRDPVSDFIESF
jgi:hypothetical protein